MTDLSGFALKNSVGRRFAEKDDAFFESDPFFNDFSKIIQSKSYRRLAYKTQVVSLPDNPHVRTRLVHTNEVIALSGGISNALGLNTNLCLAIAAGHDLGHTPYGHLGESVLSKLGGKPFRHNINSVVIAQHVERQEDPRRHDKGLNLSYETLKGMLLHARGSGELKVLKDEPQEYAAVMFADKIAYTISDLNDALRYGVLKEKEIPRFATELGFDQRARIENVLKSLVKESKEKGKISFSEGEVFEKFDSLKKFMYKEVYPKLNQTMHEEVLKQIHDYMLCHREFEGLDPVFLISLMTDKEANFFAERFLKSLNPPIEELKHFGIFEIIPHIKGKKIDYTNPDLDWKEKAVR
jgi:dGTPase